MPSRTKFEIEWTGLRIRFEGEREDLPRVAESVGNQFGALLQTPAIVAPAERRIAPPSAELVNEVSESKSRRQRSKSSSNSNGSKSAASKRSKEPPINWKHDPARWGNPLQEWNPTKKAIWMLYVVGHETGTKEMTAPHIATTFNQHFRHFGKVLPSNVSRDMRKAAAHQPALVQCDSTVEPSPWYLTEAGNNEAAKSVEEARGQRKK